MNNAFTLSDIEYDIRHDGYSTGRHAEPTVSREDFPSYCKSYWYLAKYNAYWDTLDEAGWDAVYRQWSDAELDGWTDDEDDY